MIVVMTTVSKMEDAESLARLLAAKKLAACVSIIHIEKSICLRKQKLEEAEEFMLIVKTRKGLWEKVRRAIEENHPYEMPGIIAIPAERVSPEYKAWAEKCTSRAET